MKIGIAKIQSLTLTESISPTGIVSSRDHKRQIPSGKSYQGLHLSKKYFFLDKIMFSGSKF